MAASSTTPPVARDISLPGGEKPTFAPNLPDRIPSLDGLRAASILLVVVAHVKYNTFGHLGNYGVRMFFLISGFLITGLLLREFDRTGGISLRKFYMRRAIRIFPAFYFYVAVVVVLAALGIVRLLPGDVWHALTYTMNFKMVRSWYLNHTWSLSVEEQFYLLWPAVIMLAGPKRGLRAALATILIVPFIRLIMFVGFDASATALGRNFQAVCDALATGCLLAGMYNRLGADQRYTKLQSQPAYLALPLGLILVSGVMFKLSQAAYYFAGQTVANFGCVLLLDYAVRMPQSLLGKVLNSRPLVAIGVWSYSLYLWQELFLDEGLLGNRFPLNILCVTAASLLAYYLIEKPFLKLRSRFQPMSHIKGSEAEVSRANAVSA